MINGVNLDQIPLQQQGQMFYSRPIYGVISTAAYRNSIYWYTSLVSTSPFLQPLETTVLTSTGAAGVSRPFDLYNYPVTTLQYHFFTLMPGKLTDPIGSTSSTDYTKLRLAIIDVRTLDEVMRWPLQDCGDGVYNATAFEQCDYNAAPPAPTAAPYASYVYPTTGTLPYKGGNTAGIFYNSTLGDYRKCSDNCQQYPVYLCGDGIQSNGPNNADGREECDDGNTVSGDGCSSTCRIEYGYECPVWGELCDLKCGNGVIDPPYLISAGVYRTEQCDMSDSRVALGSRAAGTGRNSDAG